ncbi:MAG TPA: hypothetical protein DDW87_11700 [Firmicutes bacterium]|nr:hypothetical protein [Bacillota bacterium]
MDEKQKASFLKQMYGNYHYLKPSDGAMEIWKRHLSDIDYDTAIKNLDRHVVDNGYPPTISDILNPNHVNGRKKNNPEETQSVHALMAGGFELYDPDKH